MKKILTVTAFIVATLYSGAQKPIVDSGLIKNWVTIGGLAASGISSDGKYVYYTIYEKPFAKVVVHSVLPGFKREIVGASGFGFSSDSKKFVFKSGDTVCLLSLNKDTTEMLAGIKSIVGAAVGSTEYINWIAFQYKGDPSEMVYVRSIVSSHQFQLAGVIECYLNKFSNSLLVKSMDANRHQSLSVITLSSGMLRKIWKSSDDSKVGECVFSENGEQVAFIVKSPEGNSLWYFRNGMVTAEEKVNNHTVGLDSGWEVGVRKPRFTNSGLGIIFNLSLREQIRQDSLAVAVDVWHYRDEVLPPNQELISICEAAIGVTESKVRTLFCARGQSVKIVGDVAIFRTRKNPLFNWVERDKDEYRWFSLVDEKHGSLGQGNIGEIFGSPDGHRLWCYDNGRQGFFSVDLLSNRRKAIPGYRYTGDRRTQGSTVNIGWLPDGRMLASDQFDIWALDPKGHSTVNLTGGYGRLHKVQFGRFNDEDWQHKIHDDTILRLTAFDKKTKYSGFYQSQINKPGIPEQLFMGPYSFSTIPWFKAHNNSWLVIREGVSDAPNYFVTQDLKNFKVISDIQPHRRYNWIKAERIHYKQTNGEPTEAVLYKPEDFDPGRKYPLIFLCYETMTEKMYEFKPPGFTNSDINIPWFVSRGYLVCTPDIQYTMGRPGESACSSVEGAALYLKTLSFIDAVHMGIDGHSFGGYETSYIVTHSKLFRAACTASGQTDLLSFYSSQWGRISAQAYTEASQGRMGGTPWGLREQYLKNSPVWHADKVITPLLMMANKKDEYNYLQGIEFFLALRRLNKKAWLLQYDDGMHGLGARDGLDFTIRVTQFFDHYLKGEPAPKWMVEGLPQRYKGKRSNFELEPAGIEPQ